MSQVQIDGATQIREASITSDRMVEDGLADDRLEDRYIKADGSRAFTGDVDVDGYRLMYVADPQAGGDAVNQAFMTNTYPSYSRYLEAEDDVLLTLPADPLEHQMEVVEVRATAGRVIVSAPADALLCFGTHRNSTLEAGKTGFYGFRWSSHASAWFFLSEAIEA